MADTVHLIKDNEWNEVWCGSLAFDETTNGMDEVDKATCIPCLKAAAKYGDRASQRLIALKYSKPYYEYG